MFVSAQVYALGGDVEGIYGSGSSAVQYEWSPTNTIEDWDWEVAAVLGANKWRRQCVEARVLERVVDVSHC